MCGCLSVCLTISWVKHTSSWLVTGMQLSRNHAHTHYTHTMCSKLIHSINKRFIYAEAQASMSDKHTSLSLTEKHTHLYPLSPVKHTHMHTLTHNTTIIHKNGYGKETPRVKDNKQHKLCFITRTSLLYCCCPFLINVAQ